ncbi:hypothetical protein [Thaumasiovibrio sp. DFM-14]|uniref:hypothetical protein n=1 Tax=Thaumasiovibrio sp. DFM-14 TaxID=3384792 RepID=UPI0039A3E65A
MKPLLFNPLGKIRKPIFFLFFSAYYTFSGAILVLLIRQTMRFSGLLVMLPVAVIGGTMIALAGDWLANKLTAR